MNNAMVLAVIVALLGYLATTVDAQRHRRGISVRCSPWYQFSRWGQPDFLKNATDEGFKQFCDILTNQNLTRAEIREQLEQWAKNQGSDIYGEFNKYVEEKKQRRDNIEKKMQELIADITKFIEDVKNIMNDMGLTRGGEREKDNAQAHDNYYFDSKYFQLFNLTQQSNWTVVALATKVRKEAGFLATGNHGRPCPWCEPMFPPLPRPFGPSFHPHGQPHFGRGMSGRRPHSPQDGLRPNGRFRPNGPLQENGSSDDNVFPVLNGPFTADSDMP
ncbi:unnamed protein product [Toxocara canis]|uniref:DUF148 domain-containing protein n=1 Tax=Toxocara canis TaxID=6265 RepID=A0A183UND5_TOXCA|nr:unnamed protein product [Toxocara canis]